MISSKLTEERIVGRLNMSRTEEIRAKFREKGAKIKEEISSPFGIFRKKLYSFVLNECSASIEDGFSRRIFDEFNRDGAQNIDAWLLKTVKTMFKFKDFPPRWRAEPRWCFLDDLPMTFVAQYENDEETFYVFEGFRAKADGSVRVTKIGAQGDNYIVNLEGEVVG